MVTSINNEFLLSTIANYLVLLILVINIYDNRIKTKFFKDKNYSDEFIEKYTSYKIFLTVFFIILIIILFNYYLNFAFAILDFLIDLSKAHFAVANDSIFFINKINFFDKIDVYVGDFHIVIAVLLFYDVLRPEFKKNGIKRTLIVLAILNLGMFIFDFIFIKGLYIKENYGRSSILYFLAILFISYNKNIIMKHVNSFVDNIENKDKYTG